MKAKTLQIVWHSKGAVYSLDFHPSGLLATGGLDKDIKVTCDEDGNPSVTHKSSLSGHTNSVNSVRFSPTGQQLATGGDAGELLLWNVNLDALSAEEAHWSRRALGSHVEMVSDVCWAPDGTALVSASVENVAVLWDAASGQGRARFENHSHFVQGVAWDPACRYIVTQSADRTCRVYAPKPPAAGRRKADPAKVSCLSTIKDFYPYRILSHWLMSGEQTGVEASGEGKGKAAKQALFQDENLASFFRRLAWSPDGSFLAVPAGIHKERASGPATNTTYIYAPDQWSSPLMHLPLLHAAAVVAVRFCPVIFALPEGVAAEGGPVRLPYRMVFAAATQDSVVIYDTLDMRPVAVLGALHYAAITDLAWSSDARYLAISSSDGFCSIAAFEDGELGTPVDPASLPEHIAQRIAAAAKMLPPRPTHAAIPAHAKPSPARKPAAADGAKHITPQPLLPASLHDPDASSSQHGAAPHPSAAADARQHADPAAGKRQSTTPTPGKAKRQRITPTLIPPSSQQPACARPPAAAGAVAPPGPRRITPMPVPHGATVPATSAPEAAASVGSAPRRITPARLPHIPEQPDVQSAAEAHLSSQHGASPRAPPSTAVHEAEQDGADETAQVHQPAAALPVGGGLSIAAMAAAAGQAAATAAGNGKEGGEGGGFSLMQP